jgi:tRNA U55 pseudouridine synthase TruB
MAADSAVMVIDGAKGVEPQTKKLFKVCTMRHIPIFTFINKMDRDALDTFDLLDDIEKNLGIDTCPMNWPIGSGKAFKGVFDREKDEVITYADTQKGTREGTQTRIPMSDDDRIIRTLKSFEGNIEQIPPKYSAVRVNGRRLYEYARAGKDVEIRPRKVMIQSIDIQSIVNDEIRFKMKCGKGTYVRSVCHDAGELLGTGAVMTQLCRTANGSFKAEDAVDIREIKDSSAELVRKMIRPFYDSLHFRKIHVDHKEAKALSDGKTIYSAGVFEKNEKLSVYTDGFFVGVCVYNEGSIKAHKIFNTEII